MGQVSASAVIVFALSAVGMVGAATFAVSQGEQGGLVEEEVPDASAGDAKPALDPAPATAPDAGGGEPREGDEASAASETPELEADGGGSLLGNFFAQLTAETVASKVGDTYASDVRFEDPFGRYEGRDATVGHLSKVLSGATSLQFEIKEEFVSGEETVALWTLRLAHQDLNNGDAITVDGVTHYRSAGGKIAYQRDYYDLGALLYENVWGLGVVVKWIKAKAI